jgi:hypothetical protein
VELTLSNVTSAGLTWLESRSDLVPAPPAGLQAGSPPYYYDVQSTATFIGGVNLCFNIRGISFARPQDQVLIYTIAGGVWTPLANHTTPNAGQICGDTSSLGTLALFYPQVAETAISTIAGTGFAEGSIDGAGNDPRDDFAEFVPAVQSTLTRPGFIALATGGALAAVRRRQRIDVRLAHPPHGSPDRADFNRHRCGRRCGFAPIAVDPGGQSSTACRSTRRPASTSSATTSGT